MHRLGWYRSMWLDPHRSGKLALTLAERDGDYTRVKAGGLLRRSAFAPFLRGIEPYGRLVRAITAKVADSAAVLEFSYDWRLSVTHNATLLRTAAATHLDTWRRHQRYQDMLRRLPDTRPAQLVLVAHSMGGLLVRALEPGLDIRATVTLGTPFDGAAEAALILNTGRGAPVPLPRIAMRELATTLPGLHDLLPVYRCIDDLDNDTDPRRLTPADVEAIGGDRHLAESGFAMHRQTASTPLARHHAVVGVRQPTTASLRLREGVVEGLQHTFQLRGALFARDSGGILVRNPAQGDGTVPDNSARPDESVYHGRPTVVPQHHGSLARCTESIEAVCAVLLERDPDAERLGECVIGVGLPDLAVAGKDFAVTLTGITGKTDAAVTIHDESNVVVASPPIYRSDGRWQATVSGLPPGIYRVTVAGGACSAITQLVLVDQAGNWPALINYRSSG